MARAGTLLFEPVREAVTACVTKFGGQPCWLEAPQWPLSRATGQPMRFIAQVALEAPLFAGTGGRMAYLFMTDDPEQYVDGTWEPEGGENAVVVQPGHFTGPAVALAQGPSLYRMAEVAGEAQLQPQAVEFRVQLRFVEEPGHQPESVRGEWTQEQQESRARALEGSKVGGTPGFLQGDEFPQPGDWKLLLQLDSTTVPFYVNFGDAGIGYAFIDQAEQEGRFLWQCC